MGSVLLKIQKNRIGLSEIELGYDPVSKDYKVLAFIKSIGHYMRVRDLPSYAHFLIDPNVDSEDSMVLINAPAFVQVYTVGTGVWRNIMLREGHYCSDDDKHFFWWYLIKSPVHLNGMIYWIGLDCRIRNGDMRNKSPRIVSFDVGVEVFEWTMKIPAELDTVVPIHTNFLGVMGESLVL